MSAHDLVEASPSADMGELGGPFAAGNTATVAPRPPRRRGPLVLAVLIGAGLGALAMAAFSNSESTTTDDSTAEVALAMAPVEQSDIVTASEWAAVLSYGDSPSVTSAAEGTVTSVLEPGALVERGTVVASVDAEPIVAWLGHDALWRELSNGDEGPDVTVVEQNLVALGYDPDQTVTIDEEFTYNTELMVRRWQEDLGVEETGDVAPEAVVVLGGRGEVVESTAVGSLVGPGDTLVSVRVIEEVTTSVDESNQLIESTTATQEVTVSVDVSLKDDFAPGQPVIVRMADETEFAGQVVEIAELATTTEGSDVVTVEVRIEMTDPAAVGLDPADVTVVVQETISAAATVVPSRALVALLEGGYAVEVLDESGQTSLVAVETGEFSDGLVEIVSGDLDVGDQVVVPQ